jgi:hypothetical protein
MKDSATLAVVKFIHDLVNFMDIESDLPEVVYESDDDDDSPGEIILEPVPDDIMIYLESIKDAVSLILPLLKMGEEYMSGDITNGVFLKRCAANAEALDEVSVELGHSEAAPTVQRLLDQFQNGEPNV